MAEQAENVASWFRVEDDTLEEGAVTIFEPEMTGVPAAFLQRLRDKVDTWRSLGLTNRRTSAAYANGRLWIGVSLIDREGGLALGSLRVDVTDTGWIANWVTGDPLTTEFAHAQPFDDDHAGGPISDLQQGVDAAVGWLEQELSRPITRRSWRKNGKTIAKSWSMEDTGHVFVASGDAGYWQKPETATETVQVRP